MRRARTNAPPRTQAQRTEETRNKLLDAAQTIFVRWGFEAATIEEIAGRAGYTRGAFYCNFKSKEEIFIAAIERLLAGWGRDFNELSRTIKDPRERLAALQQLYARISSDDTAALLAIEFKLYAVRHPKRHAKLAAAYAAIRRSRERLLERSAKELGLQLPVPADVIETAFAGLLTGLCLDRVFYVQDYKLAPAQIETIVNMFFERAVSNNHRT